MPWFTEAMRHMLADAAHVQRTNPTFTFQNALIFFVPLLGGSERLCILIPRSLNIQKTSIPGDRQNAKCLPKLLTNMYSKIFYDQTSDAAVTQTWMSEKSASIFFSIREIASVYCADAFSFINESKFPCVFLWDADYLHVQECFVHLCALMGLHKAQRLKAGGKGKWDLVPTSTILSPPYDYVFHFLTKISQMAYFPPLFSDTVCLGWHVLHD